MAYDNAPEGEGREKHHVSTIEAAQAVGVQHIYYTSRAFAEPSKAGVMRAHLRTKAFLSGMVGPKYTVIREGLYNESWPSYFGHYDTKRDDRNEIVVAGDGPICWTALRDLGYANALVLVDPPTRHDGKVIYLCSLKASTLNDIAKLVSQVRGTEANLKVVSRDEYCQYYIHEKGRNKANIERWCTTYDALKDKECLIADGILADLLRS